MRKERVNWEIAVQECLAVREQLVSEGMPQPTIRGCFYRMGDAGMIPGSDGDYNTLCTILGEKRDAGELPFGLFSSEAMGEAYEALTEEEIQSRIARLRGSIRAQLIAGALPAILIEKSGLLDMVIEWTGSEVTVASCQGNLRREFLHRVVSRMVEVCEELGGRKVKMWYLGDMDEHGIIIGNATMRWITRVFRRQVEVKYYAVTAQHMRAINRVGQHIHLDGFIAVYGPRRLKKELREAIGLE